MSRGYGSARDPDAPGGLWSREAGVASADKVSVRFAREDDGAYTDKYLQTPWVQKLAQSRAVVRSATVPLSLLFPILVLLMISITLSRQGSGESIDPQLGVRLAAYALAAMSVLFALGRRQFRLTLPLLVWVCVAVFIAATALYAPEPLFSLTAGAAHLALLLFAWRIVSRHGQSRVALAIVVTGSIVCALSIVSYFVFPDIARSTTAEIGSVAGRMRGVTAQPNTLGSISALTVLLAAMHFRGFSARQRVLAAVGIALAAICLFYSDSRTSIATMLLCLLLWRVCRANAAFNLFAVAGIALVACLIFTFVPDVSIYLTRGEPGSGELASLNGRSRIWSVAWESIYAHPLLGQGYGSSRLLLPTDDRLFGAAVNTHNVYLELLFSGGVVLLALFAIAVGVAIVRSARRHRVEALIALLFFLIRGAAEAAPFGGLPLFPAFVFYAAVSLCLARAQGPRTMPATRPKLQPIGSARLMAGTGRRATSPRL